MRERITDILRWLEAIDYSADELTAASADASFRRYYRARVGAASFIVMDAPPQNEDCRPFIDMARRLGAIGLNVPRVLAQDLEQGFLLLTDLGRRQYLQQLGPDTAATLYADALDALLILQSRGPGADALPPYDKRLLTAEMDLFRQWFLNRHLGLKLDAAAQRMLDAAFAFLAAAALEQPRVCVHRDYHSRNLMVTARDNPGILDFQDAVHGPVTYDLVSLLRDCYIAWPPERVRHWALSYYKMALQAGVFNRRQADEEQFLRWFDLMGAQRHLKAVGIFARLSHRDGKPGYLADIPRTLAYARAVCGRYSALRGLGDLLDRINMGAAA